MFALLFIAQCEGLPDHAALRTTTMNIVKLGVKQTTGLGNHRWAAVVNRDGAVCAVAFSGENRGEQWPGSRLIAVEKAGTANALSLPGYALSTGNLWAATQPNGSLYGLITLAPPNPAAAFAGPAADYGQAQDPLLGKALGGIVVFAGGLPLYDSKGKLLGGLGISGDTSCSDHVVAWRVRHAFNLDSVPAGPAPNSNDNLILDPGNPFGHPSCKGGVPSDAAIQQLPEQFPVGPKK